MNEVSNGSGAVPDGFSAVSVEELDQTEGGFFYSFFQSVICLAQAQAYLAKNPQGIYSCPQ